MTEPRFVRLKPVRDIFPTCLRCGRVLRGMQVRWCSHTCRVAGSRWKRDLDRYWGTDPR